MSTLDTSRFPRATPEGLADAVRYALSEGEAFARQGRSAVRSVIYALTARVVLEAGVVTPLRAGLVQALDAGERSESHESAASVLQAALERFVAELISVESAGL